MRAARTGVLLIAGVVSSCRVGPNYQSPVLPHGADAPLTSVVAEWADASPTPDAWWQLYSDPRLDAFVLEALHANRDLAAAEANFTAARAVVAGAKAARYPATKATVAGIYGRDPTTDEILELTGHAPETIWLIEDIFEVSYEVDLFGHVHRSVEAARASAASVAAARDALRVVTVAATARAFAQICALGEQLAVSRRSLDIVAHEAAITQHRYEAGANSSLDVARALALVAQVHASLASLEGQRKASFFELAALLGRTPSDAPRELESCNEPPRLPSVLPVGDGALLLRRRPDVRQAERRLAASTAQIGVATAELYPVIHLGGFVGSVGSEISDLTSNLGLAWGIGPSISWNFPNQLGARARVRQARASQVAALATFDSTVLGALKECEQALSLYTAALESRKSLGEAQDRIHAAFGIAHEQFLAGGVSNLDLLTTEQSLVSIDASVAGADALLVQDQIAVFKALGGGWQSAPPAVANSQP